MTQYNNIFNFFIHQYYKNPPKYIIIQMKNKKNKNKKLNYKNNGDNVLQDNDSSFWDQNVKQKLILDKNNSNQRNNKQQYQKLNPNFQQSVYKNLQSQQRYQSNQSENSLVQQPLKKKSRINEREKPLNQMMSFQQKLGKKERKMNKGKSKGGNNDYDQFSSDQYQNQSSYKPQQQSNAELSQIQQNYEASEYYSIDPEANGYQSSRKRKTKTLSGKQRYNQAQQILQIPQFPRHSQSKDNQAINYEQQKQEYQENYQNFDWNILQNNNLNQAEQSGVIKQQNQKINKENQKTNLQIENYFKSSNLNAFQKMWKYGIDKICQSIQMIGNRSIKLQRLVHTSCKTMMKSNSILSRKLQIVSQNMYHPHNNGHKCYLVNKNTQNKSNLMDKIDPYRQSQNISQDKMISKYEAILKQTQAQQEQKLLQLQKHIKDLKNERKKLKQSLNLTRRRCRFSQSSRNYSKQFQKAFEQAQYSEKQTKKRKINKTKQIPIQSIQISDDDDRQHIIKHQGIVKNKISKDVKRAKNQINIMPKQENNKEKCLSVLQNLDISCQKRKSQSSQSQNQRELNQIIQQLALDAQLEKIRHPQAINLNNPLPSIIDEKKEQFVSVNEIKKQNIQLKLQDPINTTNNDNFTVLAPRLDKYEEKKQVKIQNTHKVYVKSQEKNIKDKMLKKLQAIKRDSELNKLKKQQQAQQYQERIARTKEQKQKQPNPSLSKKQRKANKQILLIKHINKSLAIRYKKVDYYFSEFQKHLQLCVMDRDTVNSLSDDNHQKIVTISPQLDHQYSLHRVHLKIVNVEYWVAVGICDIDLVKKNRCLMKVRQFGNHGVYMLGSNGFSYSNYSQEDHRIDKGFKFKSGDVIRVNVDSSNSLITFIKGKGQNVQKYSMKYNPILQLGKIRFCAGLCRTKDIIRIQNYKNSID